MLDEFRSTSITWDKATRRIYSPITANGSDSNGRKLNIQVVNSGQVENLTGATLHLYWETKDKTQHGLDAFTASDISKGEFEIFYTTGMLSNVGELNATLVLVDATGQVVSDWFKITVVRGIDDDAIQSENSFTTLTQALIDISNLEQNYTPRLNDLTAQLQQKASQSDLESALAAVADGGPSIIQNTYDSLVANYPDGATGTALVLETDPAHVYVWYQDSWKDAGVYQGMEVKDGTISSRKTDFIRESTNLFDKKTVKNNKNISLTTGMELDNTNYKASLGMEVVPGQQMISKNIHRRIFYRKDGSFISGDEADGIFTIPGTASIMRVVIANANLNTAQINRGSVLLPYENHFKKVESTIRTKAETEIIPGAKTRFLKNKGTNLYNFRTLNRKKSVDSNTGMVVENETHGVTEPIKLTPATDYVAKRIAALAFYDEANEFIIRKNLTDGVLVTSPENAAYGIGIVVLGYYDSAQLNEGTVLKDYEDYYLEVDGYKLKEKTSVNDVTFLSVVSNNIFNRHDVDKFKSLNESTGELKNNAYHHTSRMIAVEPLTAYSTKDVERIALYNRSGQYIRSFVPTIPFETPADCYGIKATITQYNLGVAQINKGNFIKPYDEFELALNEKRLKYKESFKDADRYLLDGSLEQLFRVPRIEGDANLLNLQTSQIYAKYDDILNQFPTSVTRSVLGTDGREDEIRRYDFKFYSESDVATKTIKVILISGMHGEKAGILNLYHTMKFICENWQENETLETLRYNFHFIVIPVVNIYGTNNAVRKNENGVDLCRNFPEGWTANPDTSSAYYPGTEPMSEKGTQLIYQLLQDNKDAVLFNSSHNFSTDEGTMQAKDFMYTAGVSTLQAHATEKIFAKFSRIWKKENAWLPQDETVFGYAVKGSQNGSEVRQAGAFGIFSSAFEVTQNFKLEEIPQNFSSTVLTFGAEIYLNWLAYNLKTVIGYLNN